MGFPSDVLKSKRNIPGVTADNPDCDLVVETNVVNWQQLADAINQVSGVATVQKHYNSTISPTNEVETVAAAAGKKIKAFIIQNPIDGPNQNQAGDVVFISLDGGANKWSIPLGGVFFDNDSDISSFQVSANKNNTNFEIVYEEEV